MSPVQALEQLPESLAGFQRARPASGDGTNASVFYRADQVAAIATIYVYARGPARLPEGANDLAVTQELAEASQAIALLAAARRLASVRQNRDLVLSSNGRPVLRCDAHTQAGAQNGVVMDSFICVGLLGARFLKLRLTMLRSPAAGAADAVLSVLSHRIVGAMSGRPPDAWRLSSTALPSG
jgi:hypothetical protein